MKIQIQKPILLVVLSGVAASANAQSFSVKTEQDIREAALRYQFDHNSSGLKKRASAYFVAEGRNRKDPSPQFLKRFARQTPRVKRASQSVRGPEWLAKDKATGKPGLLFFTADLKWLSPTKARIDAGYQEGNLSAGVNTYTVERKGQKWSVTQDKPGPVS